MTREMILIIDFRKTLIMPDTAPLTTEDRRKRLIFLHSDPFNLHFVSFQITEFRIVFRNLQINVKKMMKY